MKTILVGYDVSEPSLRALDRAASLADAFEARLVVTNVASRADRSRRPADPAPAPRDFARQLAPARAYLEDRGVRAEYVAAEGEPTRMIASVADEPTPTSWSSVRARPVASSASRTRASAEGLRTPATATF